MRYVCTEDDQDILELAVLHTQLAIQIKDQVFGDALGVYLNKEDVKRLIDDLKTCLENMKD